MTCSSGQTGYSTSIECPPSGGGSDLPMTGADLGVVAGAGLLLVVIGAALARLGRKPVA